MKTRKMSYSLTKDGRASLRGEHLVPCLEIPRKNVLVGVKNGKKYKDGYLVYLGKDLTTEDILNELGLGEGEVSQARPVIDSFLAALQSFKIGNVISLSFSETDECVLTKQAERPASERPKRWLP
jgi:hypothetical protein